MRSVAPRAVTVNHLVRGVQYQVPSTWTDPNRIDAAFREMPANPRFDSMFAHIFSMFKAAMGILKDQQKRNGTTKNYALCLTTLTVMKQHNLRLSLGDLKQQNSASKARRKEPIFANQKLVGIGR